MTDDLTPRSSDEGGPLRVTPDMVQSLMRTVRAVDLPMADTPWSDGAPVELAARYRDEFGAIGRVIVHDGDVISGHEHVRAALTDGPDAEVVVFDLTDLGPRERVLAAVIGERRQSETTSRDDQALADMLLMIRDYDDQLLEVAGWSMPDLDELLDALDLDRAAAAQSGRGGPKMTDTFIVPPFSVLDTRQGYWQDRKREWLAYGMRSELGRGDRLTYVGGDRDETDLDPVSAKIVGMKRGSGSLAPGSSGPKRSPKDVWLDTATGKRASAVTSRREADAASNLTGAPKLPEWADNGTENMAAGTSIFDPVLCEVAYRWFIPVESGRVLDPFAGGVVRGAVASILGHRYVGVDLSEGQVKANRAQEWVWGDGPAPTWVVGNSIDLPSLVDEDPALAGPYDLVFTCPPYYDLEVYSDADGDLSSMESYEAFLSDYRAILAHACAELNEDRFAVVVVSEVRDSHRRGGPFVGLVPDTIRALTDAGLVFYNEMILVNAAGTLPLRAARQFQATRKIGRTHQNVIVAYKGNPAGVSAVFPDIAIPDTPFGDVTDEDPLDP